MELITSVVYDLSNNVSGFGFHGGVTNDVLSLPYLASGTYVLQVTTSIGVFSTYFVKE